MNIINVELFLLFYVEHKKRLVSQSLIPQLKEAILVVGGSDSIKEAMMKQTNKENIELLEIKEDNELTQADIADMLNISINTVKSYLCNPESKRYRDFPSSNLKHLKMVVKYELWQKDD